MNGHLNLIQRVVRTGGRPQTLLSNGLGHLDSRINVHTVIVVESGNHNIEFTHIGKSNISSRVWGGQRI